jgi:hypothetical protein
VSKFLAKLQEQYEQGKFCDVRICCVVLPDPKGQEQQQEDNVKDKGERSPTDLSSPLQKDGEDANDTEDEDESLASVPVSPQQSQQNQPQQEEDEKEDEHKPKDVNAGSFSPPPLPSQTRTTDILCHANVLCARSPYFASSLGGEWNEAQTKTVEVVLENEQAVQDMNLLIKLCYSGSYIQDEEEPLDVRTRIGLAFLGNAFEMQDCVWECLESLKEGLSVLDALTILEDVPEELRGHGAMAGVNEKVVAILSKALNEFTESDPPTAAQKQWKQMVGDALANALGPVNQLFGESSWLKTPQNHFYTCLPLKSHILALSLTAMEVLLASDALHVSTENEVYTLLGCWVHQTHHLEASAYEISNPLFLIKRLPYFKHLVKLVRLHHLSSEYLANVVTACPLAGLSALIPFILRSSLIMRDRDVGLRGGGKASSLGAVNRGRGGAGWLYSSMVELANLLPLTKFSYMHKCLGLVDGYPIRIMIGPRSGEGKEPLFGLYVHIVMPVWTGGAWEGGVSRRASLEYNLRVGMTDRPWVEHGFDGSMAWGSSDYFGKPWEEIVRDESAYFPGGQTTVEVGMRLPSKGEEGENVLAS